MYEYFSVGSISQISEARLIFVTCHTRLFNVFHYMHYENWMLFADLWVFLFDLFTTLLCLGRFNMIHVSRCLDCYAEIELSVLKSEIYGAFIIVNL